MNKKGSHKMLMKSKPVRHEWNFVAKDFLRRRHDQRFHIDVVTRSGIGHDLKLAKTHYNGVGCFKNNGTIPFTIPQIHNSSQPYDSAWNFVVSIPGKKFTKPNS